MKLAASKETTMISVNSHVFGKTPTAGYMVTLRAFSTVVLFGRVAL
jgi:hypothetical protein